MFVELNLKSSEDCGVMGPTCLFRATSAYHRSITLEMRRRSITLRGRKAHGNVKGLSRDIPSAQGNTGLRGRMAASTRTDGAQLCCMYLPGLEVASLSQGRSRSSVTQLWPLPAAQYARRAHDAKKVVSVHGPGKSILEIANFYIPALGRRRRTRHGRR